jgi:branched-chain amino acid transport system permease protein
VPRGFLFWLAFSCGLFLVPALDHSPYFLSELMLFGMYFSMNLMWSLVVGTAGLYSFATLAIAGISTYAGAWLSVKHGWPWWLYIPTVAVLGAVVGLLVALPAVRLRGVYFALLTIGLVELCRSYVQQDRKNFGGAQGLTGTDSMISASLQGTVRGYLYAYGVLLIVIFVTLGAYWWVQDGRLGLRLRTARESEPVAQALGIDIPRSRLAVFVITSAVLGLVGGYKAAYAGSAVPADFAFSQLLLLFAMIVVGGLESPRGIAIGTALLLFVDQHYLDQGAKRLIALGLLMLLVTLFTTSGLAGIPGQIRAWINAGSSSGRGPPPDALAGAEVGAIGSDPDAPAPV